MRLPTHHSFSAHRLLPIWGAAVTAALLATATAAPPQKTPRGKKPAAPAALPPPEMDRSSSRFILPENQAAFLDKMRAQMSMTKRVSDPFGRSQDPDAAPPPIAVTPGSDRPVAGANKVTLEKALANFKINTIIPHENRFLANSQSYRKGESIQFKSRGKIIQVQVMSVSASEIVFRNAETGEIASKKMKLLPPGMQPGTALSEAPGLFRNQKDVPINLDAPGLP